MKEQRKHHRYFVESRKIPFRKIFASDVDVMNVSKSGISIRSTKCFDIGHTYMFNFNIHGRTVSVKANVKWVTLISNKKQNKNEVLPIYLSGMESNNISSEQLKQLARYVEEVCKSADSSRLRSMRRLSPLER